VATEAALLPRPGRIARRHRANNGITVDDNWLAGGSLTFYGGHSTATNIVSRTIDFRRPFFRIAASMAALPKKEAPAAQILGAWRSRRKTRVLAFRRRESTHPAPKYWAYGDRLFRYLSHFSVTWTLV